MGWARSIPPQPPERLRVPARGAHWVSDTTILSGLPAAALGALATLMMFGRELDMYGFVGISRPQPTPLDIELAPVRQTGA